MYMKKIIIALLFLSLWTNGCKHTEKTGKQEPQVPAKEVEKDEAVLKFRMIPVENMTVEQTAKAFKDYLQGEGMYYPKFQDFHRAATLDNVEFEMRPTVLVVYGNPKELGRLINENQEIAYDLPFRILVYQDDSGNVMLLYRDFGSLKQQYILTDPNGIMDKYDKLMKGFEKRLHQIQIKRQNEKTL